MSPSRALIALICLSFFPALAVADSIIIDGIHYQNVYVGMGAAMYYIQDPSDGSMISIPKTMVDPADVALIKDRVARRKLRDEWKRKRSENRSDLPLTISYDEWRNRLEDTLPAVGERQATVRTEKTDFRTGFQAVQSTDGTVHFTNRPRSSGAPLSGRKMFMNKDGVAIMTNKPDAFRGRSEYVEVIIHYEAITVPERFRITPTRDSRPLGSSTLEDIIDHYAKLYGLDKHLVYAIIRAESNGNQYAVSSAGARGLMQLMPDTAREMGVKEIFDPAENIAGGTQYFSKLLDLLDGNVTLALAAYNAGPGNVKKYGGVPPFDETKDFIRVVDQLQRQYRRHGAPTFDIASAKPVANDYLPPESSQYYQIVLDNGLTVAAEQVFLQDGRYIYIFKGQSGHFPESQVLSIHEPS